MSAIHELRGALQAAMDLEWRENAREILLAAKDTVSLERCAQNMKEAIEHAIKTKDRLLHGSNIGLQTWA